MTEKKIGTEYTRTEDITEGIRRPLHKDVQYQGRFKNGDATPSVMDVDTWKCGTTVVTITNFKHGQDGQTIKIIGNANTTIANNSTIKTSTASDKPLEDNKAYLFTYSNGVWYENASGAATAATLGDGDYGDIIVSLSGTAMAIDTDAVVTSKIANAAVTFAKIQDITNARLMGRYAGSDGPAQEVSVGAGLDLSTGGVLSSILFSRGGWYVNGPDVPPATPNAADDEFDGGAIDTTGSRFSGATAWAAQNIGTSVVAQLYSCLTVQGQIAAGSHLRGYEQPLPGGNWKRKIRVALSTTEVSEWGAHIWLRNNANGKVESFGLSIASAIKRFNLYSWTNVDTFSAAIANLTVENNANQLGRFMYIQLEYDGTNMLYRYSYDGVMIITFSSRLPATFLGAAPTHIGIGMVCSNNTATGPAAVFDFFRSV